MDSCLTCTEWLGVWVSKSQLFFLSLWTPSAIQWLFGPSLHVNTAVSNHHSMYLSVWYFKKPHFTKIRHRMYSWQRYGITPHIYSENFQLKAPNAPTKALKRKLWFEIFFVLVLFKCTGRENGWQVASLFLMGQGFPESTLRRICIDFHFKSLVAKIACLKYRWYLSSGQPWANRSAFECVC